MRSSAIVPKSRRARVAALVPALLVGAIAASCGAPSGSAPPKSAAPAILGAPPYRYEVVVGPGAEELAVTVDLPRGTQRLRALRSVLPFVRDFAVDDGSGFRPVAPGAGGFDVAACNGAPCRARYRVLLGAAARDLDDRDVALVHRGAFLAPSSTWLLRPIAPLLDDRFRVHVTAPAGTSYVNGLFNAAGEDGVQEARTGDLEGAPYAAFGLGAPARVDLPGGEITVAMSDGAPVLGREVILRWIDVRARAVAAYYGRAPVPHAALLVLFTSGRGIGGGSTMGSGGASVMLSLGERVPASELDDDWILVHELVHVAFPNVGAPWLEEGLATYVEPLIRVRAGLIEPDALYRDLLEGLPQGQPQPGDHGLDHTDTWGRRYWGGGLFWFLADVAIRKSTGNTRSIDDAIRRIVAQGGNVSTTWTVDHALEEGDRATGGTTLRDLRKKLGDAPVTTDLDALWKELGVHLAGRTVIYDDRAPLAAIRKAIAARR